MITANARVLEDLSAVTKRMQDIAAENTPESLAQEVARLRAENAKLREGKANGTLSLKVTEKGGVSAYGVGRWPVTLYRSQWEKLLAHKDDILAFIKANEATLSVKS